MVYGSCGDAETQPMPRYELMGYARNRTQDARI
jgi:hypothetical protein